MKFIAYRCLECGCYTISQFDGMKCAKCAGHLVPRGEALIDGHKSAMPNTPSTPFTAARSPLPVKKPPLGIMPKWLHDQIRAMDILEAMVRYSEAGMAAPKEWLIEYMNLIVDA